MILRRGKARVRRTSLEWRSEAGFWAVDKEEVV